MIVNLYLTTRQVRTLDVFNYTLSEVENVSKLVLRNHQMKNTTKTQVRSQSFSNDISFKYQNANNEILLKDKLYQEIINIRWKKTKVSLLNTSLAIDKINNATNNMYDESISSIGYLKNIREVTYDILRSLTKIANQFGQLETENLASKHKPTQKKDYE